MEVQGLPSPRVLTVFLVTFRTPGDLVGLTERCTAESGARAGVGGGGKASVRRVSRPSPLPRFTVDPT